MGIFCFICEKQIEIDECSDNINCKYLSACVDFNNLTPAFFPGLSITIYDEQDEVKDEQQEKRQSVFEEDEYLSIIEDEDEQPVRKESKQKTKQKSKSIEKIVLEIDLEL